MERNGRSEGDVTESSSLASETDDNRANPKQRRRLRDQLSSRNEDKRESYPNVGAQLRSGEVSLTSSPEG